VNAEGSGDFRFDDSFVLHVNDSRSNYEPLARALNDLHSVRLGSFFRYMEHWNPYTDASVVRLRTLVRRIAEANERRMREIADLMALFGFTPRGASFGQRTADANYTSWRNLLPRLIQTQAAQVTAVETTLDRIRGLAGEERVRPTLERQLEEERAYLAQLEAWRPQILAKS